LLKTSEESLRTILKNLSLAEEISYVKDKYETISQKVIDVPEVEVSDAKARLAKCFLDSAVSEEDQKQYYSNKEEEMCYADRRSQFMSLMLRARQLIARNY
jgi:hypothetical protein